MSSPIRDLAEEAHDIFDQYEGHDKLLTPSIPVLYFGDLNSYRSSDLKVITVGSNPSDREFLGDDGNPTNDPFWRFSSIGSPGAYDYHEYRNALAAYFKETASLKENVGLEENSSPERNDGPGGGTDYHDWFKHYDRVLKGLGASYYDGAPNTALHTDLHSPLATSVQWSSLGREAADLKEDLRANGIPLWHRLTKALEPDVILASVSRNQGHLDDITFDRVGDEEIIARLHRKTNGDTRSELYDVTAQPIQVGDKRVTLVHGPKNVYPFMIGDRQASGVGQAIYSYI